jgi:hypothetical protein
LIKSIVLPWCGQYSVTWQFENEKGFKESLFRRKRSQFKISAYARKASNFKHRELERKEKGKIGKLPTIAKLHNWNVCTLKSEFTTSIENVLAG